MLTCDIVTHWGTPKPPGAQFRGPKCVFQSRVQGRPQKVPRAQLGTLVGWHRLRATPECHSTPYNSVSGPSMVIFRRTGVHQKTHIRATFPPLGGPGHGGVGRGGHPNRPGPPRRSPGASRPNGPGSSLEAPNGAFQVGPKVGH